MSTYMAGFQPSNHPTNQPKPNPAELGPAWQFKIMNHTQTTAVWRQRLSLCLGFVFTFRGFPNLPPMPSSMATWDQRHDKVHLLATELENSISRIIHLFSHRMEQSVKLIIIQITGTLKIISDSNCIVTLSTDTNVPFVYSTSTHFD